MEKLGPDVPLHFTAFHPDCKMLDKPRDAGRDAAPGARDRAERYGLHYVYTGNVHDEDGQSTYCHGCGERLIGRDWYDITAWSLTSGGCCAKCNTPCEGIFEPRAGFWGRRRVPVSLVVSRSFSTIDTAGP